MNIYYLLKLKLKLMKKLFTLMLLTGIMIFTACGPSDKEIKEKAIQDSVRKADSIAKIIIEAESWDVYLAGKNNEAEFKSKYTNKKLLLKNLVINGIWSSKKVMQCLAYSPSEMMVSNPSKEGDSKKKISKWQDLVQKEVCKYNTDLKSFSYYFELHFDSPADVTGLKERDLKEEGDSRICNYATILTVEGDSLIAEGNNFKLLNCVIKDKNTK